MDKKIYTYTFFWMDANRNINIVKAKVEVSSTLSLAKVYKNAESVFENACKQNGYSQKQIDEADYNLAVQEGWCGE